MFGKGLRSIGVLSLSLVLAISTPLALAAQPAYGEPNNEPVAAEASPSPNPLLESMASAPVTPPATLIQSNIPVTCFTEDDPTDTMQAYMQSGTISAGRIPAWPEHSFLHAWLKSPESPGNQIGITQLDYFPAEPGNGMPNGEAYVEVKLAHNINPNVRLCVPLSQAAQYIWLEYAKTGKVIDLSYEPEAGQDIDVAGPSQIFSQQDGSASGIFTVSVPRDHTPAVSLALDTPDARITKLRDISEVDRTVFRYRVDTDAVFPENSLAIKVSSQKKGTMNIDFTKNIPNDWRNGNESAGEYGNTLYGEPTNKTFEYGGSTSFYVYCDRLPSNQYLAYNTTMAAVYLNGAAIAAPQPLLRFGKDAYNMANFQYDGVRFDGSQSGYSPPWYSTNKNDWIFYRMLTCPYLVESYSSVMGWNTGSSWGDMGYNNWYQTQIKNKLIGFSEGAYLRSGFVLNGPLAGTRYTIRLVDAIPSGFKGKLLSGETPTFTNQPGSDSGLGNPLRVVYKVDLDMLTDSVFVDTEWVQSKNVKVGVYENYGVEDVQAYVAGVGAYGGIPASNAFAWRPVPNAAGESYLDIKAIKGTQVSNDFAPSYYKPPIPIYFNEAPKLYLRGNVSNGYSNPKPESPALFPLLMKPLELKTADGAGNNPQEKLDGHGFRAQFHVPALGADNTGANCRVSFGGMNTVGVRASLMKIPVYFDLSGGQVKDTKLFPAKQADKPVRYNVESNPVVHIPTEIPFKATDGMTSYAMYWKLLYRDGRTGQLVDTKKTYFSSSSFDIRDMEDVGTRLSDIQGNKIASEFVLKAVFEDTPGDNALIYHAMYDLNDSNDHLVAQVQGSPFWAMKGLYAQPVGFPPTVEHNGVTYHIDPSFDTKTMKRLGDSSKPPFVVPYTSLTDAQRWARDHGARPNPNSPWEAVGRIQEYPYGTTMTRNELKKMIVNNSYLGDEVTITANPAIDPYLLPTPDAPVQGTILTLTFPDGSTLTPQCGAIIKQPVLTGIGDGNFPWALAAAGLGLAGAGAVAFFLWRRRFSNPVIHGRHVR